MAAKNCPVLGWPISAEIDHKNPDLPGFQMLTVLMEISGMPRIQMLKVFLVLNDSQNNN